MEEIKLKKLLKEAFNKGRDYQYDINPYSNKLKEGSEALTFTKWYNQVKNIGVMPCCKSDSELLFCDNVIHHNCKHFDLMTGCIGCKIKKFEAK